MGGGYSKQEAVKSTNGEKGAAPEENEPVVPDSYFATGCKINLLVQSNISKRLHEYHVKDKVSLGHNVSDPGGPSLHLHFQDYTGLVTSAGVIGKLLRPWKPQKGLLLILETSSVSAAIIQLRWWTASFIPSTKESPTTNLKWEAVRRSLWRAVCQ